jgi:carboxypeptidase PM20D1
MRRAAALLGVILVVLLALLARGLAARPAATVVTPAPPIELGDEAAAVERFAASLRIATISHADAERTDREAFLAFHRHLEESFPALHRALRRERAGEDGLSLLYTWPGRDAALEPIVLMAHQDVVPVEPGTEGDWEQPPFSGALAGGFVWGRGAMDTKGKLMAVCEAVERLAAEGFVPARTVHLVFGHDEEVGGQRGALEIARRFEAQGARFAWVLDEGGVIGHGLVPGVARPVAMIGIAEKGFLTLELTAHAEGGHSSMPPPQTAIGILAEAVARVERHPFPAGVRGATRSFLAAVGPEMALPMRVAVANADVLEPLLVRALARSPRSDAMLRTTTAATVIGGGVKENVLPSSARALVNFRILPGDSIESVTAHVRRVVDDARVTVAPYQDGRGFANEPSPESRTDSEGFALLARTIRESYPDVVVAPNLVLGGTDARWFRPLSDSVFRFGPMQVGPDDLKRAHGTDERLGVDDYLASIRFYLRLLRNAS